MLTRSIYPLALREKIGFKLLKYFTNIKSTDINLEFASNLKLDLSKSDIGHKLIIFNGFYELWLTKMMLERAKKGGLLIDVGANYGYYSCLWASQNSNNKVIAFEASPLNVEPLRNNITKNGFSNRIQLVPNAIGKEKGKMSFDLGNQSQQTGWGGLSAQSNTHTTEVIVDTLDDFSEKNNITDIDVLKIDTEGADTWVLYGAEKLLKAKRIKHIFFEHNLNRMTALQIGADDATKFLEKLDYVVERKSDEDFYAYPKK